MNVNDIVKYTSTYGDTTIVEYYLVIKVSDDRTLYDTIDSMGHVDENYPIGDFANSVVLSHGTKEWNKSFNAFMKELDDWNNQVTSELKKAYKFVNELKRA